MLRSIWRWTRRGLLGILALVVTVVVVALIVLHTDWGREKLRVRIVAALAEKFPGGASIGRIEGSVLGDVELHDVVLRDAAGRPAITASRLRVNLGYTALLSNELELETLDVDGAQIFVEVRAGQPPNLATAYRSDPQSQPLGWDVALRRVRLRDVDVTIDRDGVIEHLDDLAVDASAYIATSGDVAATLALTGVARERARAAIRIGAAARSEAGAVAVPEARVAVGDVSVTATDVLYRSAADVRGVVVIASPPGALEKIAPELGLPPFGIDLAIVAAPVTPTAAAPLNGAAVAPAGGGALQVRLDGVIAGATLAGQLVTTPLAARPRVDGSIEVANLDASRLQPTAPVTALAAKLDLALAIDPEGEKIALADGDVVLTARGRVADVNLDDVRAAAALDGGTARVRITGRGPGGTDLLATGDVTTTRDTLTLADGHVLVDIDSLAEATRWPAPPPGRRPPPPPATGSARVEIFAEAKVAETTHLDVRGSVRGTAIRAQDFRLGRISLDVNASGAPRAMRGQVVLVGRDLHKGPLALPELDLTVRGAVAGPVDVQLDADDGRRAAKASITAQVALPRTPGTLAVVTLGDYRFDVPRAQITGRGGTITLEDDRTIIEALRMSGAGGSLAVDATLGRGPREGQIDAEVALSGLDLAKLRGIPGVPRRLAGALAIRADVTKRGTAMSGEVQVSATNLVIEAGLRPIDVAITTEANPRRAEVALQVAGAELGSLTAAMDVKPPRRLDDLVAWSRLERSAIGDVQLDARALDLARLAKLVGSAPTVEGTVDATIAIDETIAVVSIRGNRIVAAGVPAPVDLALNVDLAQPTVAVVAARATLREVGRATLSTAVGLPSRPFDLDAWAATDLKSVQAVEVKIDELDIDDAMARRFDLGKVRGKIAATITAEAGLRAGAVKLRGRELIAGPLRVPASVDLDATLDDRGARATVDVGLGGATVITGDVTAGLTIARALAGAIDPRAIELGGELRVVETQVATLTAALGQGNARLGGRVQGTVKPEGTAAAPGGVVALVVHDLGARTPRNGGPPRGGIRELTIDATYRRGAVHAELRGDEADGGKLAILADVDPARLELAQASISATRFQIGPLTRLAPDILLGVRGELDADLQLRGADPDTARLTGVARMTGAQAPLSDVLGNLRDGTIDLSFQGGNARVTARGAVESGKVDLTATATLRGLLPERAQLDLALDDLALITEAAPRMDGKLHVDVTRAGDRWRAVARIHDASVVVPEEEGRELHPADMPEEIVFTSDLRPGREVPRTRAMVLKEWLGVRPRKPILEVELRIDPVGVVAEELRGDVGGKLTLAIGRDGASVDGRIGVVRGNVQLFERRYRLRRADLAFDGSIDPLLDIQLEYDFPQLTLRAVLGGRLSKPTLTLSSSPATYTEGQLLAFLLGGAPGSPGNEAASVATGVAAATASQIVGGFFTRRLPVRLDVLNYEPATTSSSGAFVVGRWITSRLLLLLRTRVEARADENVTEAEAEYWINPRVLLEGAGGDRGVIGLDLLWNRRW